MISLYSSEQTYRLSFCQAKRQYNGETLVKQPFRPHNRGYSRLRKLAESALRVLYFRDWPAVLWSKLPLATTIREVPYSMSLHGNQSPACRLAFVSDLHLGPTTPKALSDHAIEKIQASKADILLLGGDYVFLDNSHARYEYLTNLIGSLSIPTKLAVMGNHDLWRCEEQTVRALEAAGVQVLVNEAVHLPHPWEHIVVIGLDDPWSGNCDIDGALKHIHDPDFKIVLCHSPEGLKHINGRNINLYLCGHNHGGQIATPWGAPVLPPGKFCRRFPAGFAHYDSAKIFVSRGIGGAEVPIRLCAPADVLILDLDPKGN